MALEFLLGRYYQTSVIASLAKIKNKFKFIGIFMVIITFSIVSYYLVILGWVLSYAIFSIIGITNVFSLDDFTDSYYPILSFVVIVAINFVIIKAGINKGIERVSKIGVLLLIAIMIPLTILGISMPGSDKGIDFYLKPDFSKLTNPSVWSVAIGQAFFSLSIGIGYSPIKLTVGEQDQTIPFLDLVDSWFGTHGLAISAAIFVIAVTWFMDKKIIMQQLNLNSPIKLPFWVLTVVKFVLPVLIISTVISQIIIL